MNCRYFAAALFCVVAACTNKPIPDEYVGISTYHIVQKVRCEAQDSVRNIVIDLLRNETNSREDGSPANNTFALVKSLEKHQDQGLRALAFKDALDRELATLKPDVIKDLIDKYRFSSIAYSFTFDVTENNDVGGTSNFLDAITGGTFKLGISANNNQKRQNERSLTIVDKMQTLVITDLKIRTNAAKPKESLGCDAIDTGAGGIFYPIKGDLGLEEFFTTFFVLDRWANLVDESKDEDADKSGLLKETMTFTTTLDASVSPSIELSTGVANIRLGDASVSLKAGRTDVHKLELSVAIPTEEEVAKLLKAEEDLKKKEDELEARKQRLTTRQQKALEEEIKALARALQSVEEFQTKNAIRGLQEQRDRLFQQNAIILSR